MVWLCPLGRLISATLPSTCAHSPAGASCLLPPVQDPHILRDTPRPSPGTMPGSFEPPEAVVTVPYLWDELTDTSFFPPETGAQASCLLLAHHINLEPKPEAGMKRSHSIQLSLKMSISKIEIAEQENIYQIDNQQMSDMGLIPSVYKETSQMGCE